MTRYRTKTANILNDADRFEDKLNWQLFHQEQNTRLWGGEDGWRPGDPLYPDPRGIIRSRSEWRMSEVLDEHGEEFEVEETIGYDGNCARPMFQLFDLPERVGGPFGVCEKCLVGGGPDDDNCWNCGKTLSSPYGHLMDYDWVSANRSIPSIQIGQIEEVSRDALNRITFHMSAVTRPFEEAAQAAQRASEAFFSVVNAHIRFELDQRQAAQILGFDLGQSNESHRLWLHNLDEITPFNPASEPSSDVSVFHKPDIRGPLWGVAALYDPLYNETEVLFPLRTPEEWEARRILANAQVDLSVRRVIEPEIDVRRGELDYALDRLEALGSPIRRETPITERRRRRND